jgi:hypothetical protein
MAVSGPPYVPALQPFEDIRFLVRDRGSDFTRSYHVVFQGHCATILRTAVGVPDDERDARRTTVADVDRERIRRKPVLDDLVNEYTPAAQRTEDPQVTGRILVSCGTGAISFNLGGTTVTWFTRLFMPR